MREPLHTKPLAWLAIVLGLSLLIGIVFLFRFLNEPYAIDAQGEMITVRGRYASVADVLEAAEITLRPEDSVRPPPATAPQNNQLISVQYASPVELEIEGQTSTIWSQQTNLASFLAENQLELGPTSRIVMDGVEVSPTSLNELQIGSAVSISNQIEIYIDEGQSITPHATSVTTVGQALIEAGIDVFNADHIDPPIGSRLQPGETIVVKRAAPVTVLVDGHTQETRAKYKITAEALAEAGVGLIGRDNSWPRLDESVGDGQTIEIRRSRSSYQTTETPLPFASRLQPLDNLEIDQRSLVAAGAAGVVSRLTRFDTTGDQTYSQTLPTEWVSHPATDEVVGYGTKIVERTVDTPEGPRSYWRMVRMRVTAYTAADAGRPADHPAYGITASGRQAGYGIVAIDPDVVPFRSQVYVPGYGVAFAGDTGGGVKGRWIDLGFDDGQIQAWNGYVDVYYLTPVPEPDRINYLIPSALP
jgi:uncharacterized protein YabE (DUF348 family)